MQLTCEAWGAVAGAPVNLWTLDCGRGVRVCVSEYGAVLQAIWVADRAGEPANLALGFASLDGYVENFSGAGATYFGATVGRYANRIAGHSFMLGERTYELPGNNGPDDVHTLHGGPNGFNTRIWRGDGERHADRVAVALHHVDPAGHNGFPGQISVSVTFTLSVDGALRIDYAAATTEPTVINLTNHTYFNLAGEGSGDVYAQELTVHAETFTPTDATQIPTGEFASVAGTPFDFRAAKPIGRDLRRADLPHGEQLLVAHGYDHNWIIDGTGLRPAAAARDPLSGRTVTVWTTEPGLQVYTGNFLAGDLAGTSGRAYRPGDAFTLETQHFPDSPHHLGQPGWPSVVLLPGQPLQSTTIYRFSASSNG